MNQTPCLTDAETGETTPLPWRYEICSTCSGHGRSSAYLGAYTATEMYEAGPDFHDEYMAGAYDRTCDDCGGDGKVRVADYGRMTPAQVAAYEAECDLDVEIDDEREAERRMGC